MEKFSEIPYTRPDVSGLKKNIKALLREFRTADTFEKACEAFVGLDRVSLDAETMYSVASIRNTADLTDKFYEKEVQEVGKSFAMLTPLMKKVSASVCASPYRARLEERYGKQFFRVAEASVRLACRRNIPLDIKEQLLGNEYSKAVATCSCDFRGEKCNFYGLLRHMESTDRAERREAFGEWARLYESVSPKLDDYYDRLVALRVKKARNAGFGSFTEMAYLSNGRYDYDRGDAARFRSYVLKYITPYCEREYRRRAEMLGIEKVSWYDEALYFAEGNPTPQGTPGEMIAAAKEMYNELSPETGEFFAFMTEHELFDLITRPNKHMGGYCTYLPKYRAPFIFSNFNGTAADVDVLTHEAGHAFQAYLSFRTQELGAYVGSTSEINEIHSMTMEHFTYPWMDKFFAEPKKRVYAHLSEALGIIPYLVSVDEFQHRVYDEPTMTHEQRRACWREIEKKYMPWRDYDGNAFLESGGFWMQKQHIFLYPFYYIDYALAQTCAFMLLKQNDTDPKAAWDAYMKLCRAGGSKGYFELLTAAGLRRPFDEQAFAETVAFVTDKLEKMKKEL